MQEMIDASVKEFNTRENFEMFDITENEEELIKYPQIAIAIDMIKKGEIL